MKSNLVLRRRVDVRSWRVIGQVAKAAKRAELLPLLMRIRDRGESDDADIAAHLFFEPRSRRVVAERLLRIGVTYRLLEEHHGSYTLTESGQAAIDTEEVFVPEHGTWTVWASDDPLLAAPILRVEPWSEPTAYDEVWGKQRESAQDRSFERLPHWLRDCEGRALQPAAGSGQSLRIDEFEEEGEAVATAATAELIWEVTRSRLRMEGEIAGGHFSTEIDPPGISEREVWRELLDGEGLWRRWDPSREALLVAFDDAQGDERESMERILSFGEPSISGCGRFDAVTVSGVGLAARSVQAAQRWAEWRLAARIQDYATKARFEAWSHDAAAPFSEHRVTLPSRADLAEHAWRSRASRPSPRVWHLIAAEDWRL